MSVADEEKSEQIMLPLLFCKQDESIHSQVDLVHLCHTFRFWGVPDIPELTMKAAFGCLELELDCSHIISEFGSELTFVKDLANLRTIANDIHIEEAIRIGCSSTIVKFLHEQQGCPLSGVVYHSATKKG